jgi:opacity protein-like surface antigen
MKKILAGASLALLLTSCATMELAEQPISQYQKIVEIPNTKQDLIYDGSKQWFAKNFNDSNSVIKYDNAETGSIIGKGSMVFKCIEESLTCYSYTQSKTTLRFTVKVDSKDNRARISFEDLTLNQPRAVNAGVVSPESNRVPQFQLEVDSVKNMLDTTANSLANEVKQSVSSTDW